MKKILKLFFSILRQNKSGALTAIGLILAGYIFSPGTHSDLVTFVILGLYIFFIKVFMLKSKITFLFCLFILGLLLIEFIFFGVSENSEKASVCLFLFMATGIVQELVPNKK